MYWFHWLGSPRNFYRFAGRLTPWFAFSCALLLGVGLYLSLAWSPPDFKQGESVRIMYVHVPAAWLSLMVYVIVAGAGAVYYIWRVKIADVIAMSSAPVGASFTFLALVTGALWGRPTWGTYWDWADPRMTSELILLFLYLGYIGLRNAIEDRRTAASAAAVLALVGVVNIPIIHYSVEWWTTLHQGASVFRAGGPTIHWQQLLPLIVMGLAFTFFYITLLLVRARTEILQQERRSAWVRELMGK